MSPIRNARDVQSRFQSFLQDKGENKQQEKKKQRVS